MNLEKCKSKFKKLFEATKDKILFMDFKCLFINNLNNQFSKNFTWHSPCFYKLKK